MSAIVSKRLEFFVQVAIKHPEPVFAMKDEADGARELVEAGVLEDLDEREAGCFGLSPLGVLRAGLMDASLILAEPPRESLEERSGVDQKLSA